MNETVDMPSRMCHVPRITEPGQCSDPAPCEAYNAATVPISGKLGWGGPRANSGGPRANSGGVRPGAGRKPKPIASTQISYAVDTLRWYCVRTEYGAETAVDVAIRTAGFETLYPMLWVAPVAARRTELGRAIPAMSERLVPLLPRYLLVRFDRSDPSWRDICTMRGVERLFSTHPERPTAIPDSDVDALKRDLAPNMVLYPPVTAKSASVKKRWTDMATALATMQTEAV